MECRSSTGLRPPSAWYAQPISALCSSCTCIHTPCWLAARTSLPLMLLAGCHRCPCCAVLCDGAERPLNGAARGCRALPCSTSSSACLRKQERAGLHVDLPHTCHNLLAQAPGTSILQRQTTMCHVHIDLTSRSSLSMSRRASAGPISMYLQRHSHLLPVHLLPVHPPGRRGWRRRVIEATANPSSPCRFDVLLGFRNDIAHAGRRHEAEWPLRILLR